jgi:GLPGLI family protein
MKHLFHICILVCTANNLLFSQNFNFLGHYAELTKFEVVDSAFVKVSYSLQYNKDAAKSDEKSIDLQALLIGKNVSKYYSQYWLDYNVFTTEWVKTHDTYPQIKEKGAWSYEVFKNYPSEMETVTDIGSMLGGNYIYEEKMPVFNWQLENEYQTIFNYSCQKATVSFRGREWTSWFTPEIPIPDGPWKFGGLPGIILKVSDNQNQFVYECTGLENLKKKEPIKFYKLDYQKITRKELDKQYERFHTDFVGFLKNMYDMDVFFGKSKESAAHSPYKIPYNPVELE